MKKRVLQVKFMIVNNSPPSSDSEDDSVSDSLKELKENARYLDAMSKKLDVYIADLYHRIRVEDIDWMQEPLRPRPHIQKWCALHGLPATPTIDEFTEKCFGAAKSIDIDSRVITFHKDDAAVLWGGRRRLDVFDVVQRIPTLFE
jgi:hypothetical protein